MSRLTRLKSMDVTIAGVTRSYEFDPGIEVSSNDEGEASLEVLREAETTEVVLSNGVQSATVEVEYHLEVTGSVEVELDDLEDYSIESEYDLIRLVESGEFEEAVTAAITNDLEYNMDPSDAQVNSVSVQGASDENGDDVEL